MRVDLDKLKRAAKSSCHSDKLNPDMMRAKVQWLGFKAEAIAPYVEEAVEAAFGLLLQQVEEATEGLELILAKAAEAGSEDGSVALEHCIECGELFAALVHGYCRMCLRDK